MNLRRVGWILRKLLRKFSLESDSEVGVAELGRVPRRGLDGELSSLVGEAQKLAGFLPWVVDRSLLARYDLLLQRIVVILELNYQVQASEKTMSLERAIALFTRLAQESLRGLRKDLRWFAFKGKLRGLLPFF